MADVSAVVHSSFSTVYKCYHVCLSQRRMRLMVLCSDNFVDFYAKVVYDSARFKNVLYNGRFSFKFLIASVQFTVYEGKFAFTFRNHLSKFLYRRTVLRNGSLLLTVKWKDCNFFNKSLVKVLTILFL